MTAGEIRDQKPHAAQPCLRRSDGGSFVPICHLKMSFRDWHETCTGETVQTAICDWLNEFEISGYSAETIRVYRWQVGQLAKRVPHAHAADYTRADLVQYIADRKRAGWAEASRKIAVNAIRSFFAFTCGKRSPARTLPAPRPKPKLQRTLTAAQAFAVLAACDTQTIRGVRDLALLCLMLDTGLRASEICRLKVTDLDLERRRLTVLVKGGKLGDGVYTDYTAMQIATWLVSRGKVAADGVAELFVSIGGLTPGHSLSGSGLRVIFRWLGKAAGLSALSPHDLRRTFATLTIRNGAPTRLVQLAGRWDDLALLERYTAALDAADIEQYLPVGRLMGL